MDFHETWLEDGSHPEQTSLTLGVDPALRGGFRNCFPLSLPLNDHWVIFQHFRISWVFFPITFSEDNLLLISDFVILNCG